MAFAKSAAGPSKGSPESHGAGGLLDPLQSRSQLLVDRLTLSELHTGQVPLPLLLPPPSLPSPPKLPLLLLLPPLPLLLAPPLLLLLPKPVSWDPEPLQENVAATTTEARHTSVEVRMLMYQSYAGDRSRLNLAPMGAFARPLGAHF
jgi:hypothetical protein